MKEWLENLRNSKKLIIVEGKKDKAALEKLGITNVVAILRKPLFSFIESIEAEEVIILTDLDPEGKKLYSILKQGLQEKGIKIDNYFREYLFKKSKISQIEGLVHYLKKEKIIEE
ncbi:MAG: toprim domain-containing protein [Nanoarchaeota archaeon]|nr:toprim domain-containing protein [Nanoarchaeota archaeon]